MGKIFNGAGAVWWSVVVGGWRRHGEPGGGKRRKAKTYLYMQMRGKAERRKAWRVIGGRRRYIVRVTLFSLSNILPTISILSVDGMKRRKEKSDM